MAYSVRVDRISGAGNSRGRAQVYEAENEADAVTIAAYEIDIRGRAQPGVATVSDSAGRSLFAYTGCAGITHARPGRRIGRSPTGTPNG